MAASRTTSSARPALGRSKKSARRLSGKHQALDFRQDDRILIL